MIRIFKFWKESGGNDIVERVENFGFQVTLLRCNEIVDEMDINRMSFLPEDVVLLCKKMRGSDPLICI